VVRVSALGLATLAVAALGATQGQARIPLNAKTFVYRGHTKIGYVQRVPANGERVWSGLVLSQSVGLSGTSFTAFCNVGGVVYREGVARRRSEKRWVISRLHPQRGLAGFVVRLTAVRWSVTDKAGVRIASAKGPDGPAAGVAFLSEC
jgi:hypothetical protein